MRLLVTSLSLGTALLASPARADVPPEPDSVDAHCTLAEQCASGTLCPYAFDPSDEGESSQVGAECRAEVEKKGLERRCKDGGNYGGSALYCPPGETGTWSPGRRSRRGAPGGTARAGNCSVAGDSLGGVALLLLAIVGLRRTRRRAVPVSPRILRG
jgi:hypothetical protein